MISQPAERNATAPSECLWFEDFPMRTDPLPRLDARPENRRGRIEKPQLRLNRAHIRRIVRSCNHERPGAPETLQRLSQSPLRQQMAAAERVQRVDQNQIEVPSQPQMLKSIIQKKQPHR